MAESVAEPEDDAIVAADGEMIVGAAEAEKGSVAAVATVAHVITEAAGALRAASIARATAKRAGGSVKVRGKDR